MSFKKSLILLSIPTLMYACQEEIIEIRATPPQTNQASPSPAQANQVAVSPSSSVQKSAVPSPVASLKAEEQPGAGEVNDLDPNDNEVVGTDKEAIKTNVNWKEYNPITKGKKYIYNYSIKEGETFLQTETTWEIISVNDKSYVVRQGFVSSADNKLKTTDVQVTLNNDYSPQIIPPASVGGEKLTDVKTIQITEKPEKLKVLYKEVDAIKIVSGSVTSWYGKGIGLVKSINVTANGTYNLELKDFK